MKSTNIHPFIFNFSNSQFTDKTESDYVRFLGELLFIFNIEATFNREQFFVLNFDKNHFSKDNPTELRDIFVNSLKAKNLIKEDESVSLINSDTIVIDIANEDATIESRNLKFFLTYIHELISKWNKPESEIAIIIIGNRVFSIEDFPNDIFFDFVKDKKILLFDYKGHSSFIAQESDSLSELLIEDYEIKIKEVFKKHHKLIFGDHLEKFKRKLVGYTGHFARKLDDEIDRCHFYFYDGVYCKKELKEILITKMKNEKPDFVIVDCPESPWLFQPVYLAVSDLYDKMEIKIFKYDEELEFEDDNLTQKKITGHNRLKAIPKTSKGILLFDLIHRGNRLKKVYVDLKKINPQLELSIHTVIQAVNDISVEKRTNFFNVGESEKEVHAYHFVKQIDSRHSKCEYCNKFDIPHNNVDDLHSIELLPLNFWNLCKESKYIPEKDTPINYRSPLKAVPDFQRMLKENGAFLALKVKEVLMKKMHLSESQLSNITFIGPNQIGTQEISMCLSYFMDVELILINKEHVDVALKNQYDKNQIIETFSKEWWCSSIKNIIGSSKSKEAIVFDDFSVTKNSLENYFEFIKKLGFEVSAFFPIFKFNDIQYINKDIPIYSLYSFPLYSSNHLFNN